MRSRWRDPNWRLPETPDSPVYDGILRAYADGDVGLFSLTALNDFWFFCRYVARAGRMRIDDPENPLNGKSWFDHPWVFQRCRDIQADPDRRMRLWPRFHFKTTIETQLHTLWDLLDNANLRFGLFTYKLDKVGDTFLSGIKEECEQNPTLHEVGAALLAIFPERKTAVFWADPVRDCRAAKVKWNDSMLTMDRTTGAREPSVTVTSLVAPITSYHFDCRMFDDIVTEDAVRSKEAIEDTTERWRNIAGTVAENTADRYVGTRWAVNDTYQTILDLGKIRLDHQPLYQEDGVTPVLRSVEWVESVRVDMGPYRFSSQMLNDPLAAGRQTFDVGWLLYDELDTEDRAKRCNVYIFAETATAKKGSDYTVIWVVGLGRGVPQGNYYVLDLVRDRMGLVAFADKLFEKVAQWKPRRTFIEQVGAMRDMDYIKERQRLEGFDFLVSEVHEAVKKEDRIQRLQPPWCAGRIYLPRMIGGSTDGRRCNLIEIFRSEEFLAWNPSQGSTHDDMLDALAWMVSPKVTPYLRFPTRIRGNDNESGTPYERDLAANINRARRIASRSPWAM